MRVAIVSDPLVQRGGAERTVEAIAEAFPDAPIFALLHRSDTGPASLAPRIQTSWLNRVPLASKKHRLFLPFYRNCIESFDLSKYDVIVSSHHTVAKAVLTRADQLHVCYCHTPMRALWERPAEELSTLPKILRPLAGWVFSDLRAWDAITANRVQKFIANSTATQRRIATYYRRESEVIFPPIDLDQFHLGRDDAKEDYYLVASRPVPYKRVDIAIAATAKLGRKLKIVGGEHKISAEDTHVELIGHVGDAELRKLMQNARALLSPQAEDFGMSVLEVNACGTPVVAYGVGGALDSVIDGVTGVLSSRQDVDTFAEAIERLEGMHFDPQRLRDHAMRFSRDRYISEIREFVTNAWEEQRASISPRHLQFA